MGDEVRTLISILIVMVMMVVQVMGELVINVSRGEADSSVFRQSLSGNTSAETVTIQYVTPSGTGVVQVTDFKTGVTITAVTVPGEEELGQARYQVLCFVSPTSSDIIPPEAMTKLRQKHPGAVRVAEEGRGRVVVDNSASLIVNKAHSLSHHIPTLCKEAKETTFAPEHLLKQYQEGSLGQGKAAGQTRRENKDVAFFSKSLGGVYSGLGRCAGVETGSKAPCLCVVENCVFWYPCSLKYCRNTNGEPGEHRCGIRTCSKCTEMRFMASSKNHCSWDEL